MSQEDKGDGAKNINNDITEEEEDE